MGTPKIKHLSINGFEKKFRSITDISAELAVIWPETKRMFETEAVKLFVKYSVLKESDEMLDANLKLLKASGQEFLDDAGAPVPLARVEANKGVVNVVAWSKAGFGWKPEKKGGFVAWVQTWPGYHFGKADKLPDLARGLSWTTTLETIHTIGQRHMGHTRDLQKVLDEQAKKQAEMLRAPKLITQDSSK